MLAYATSPDITSPVVLFSATATDALAWRLVCRAFMRMLRETPTGAFRVFHPLNMVVSFVSCKFPAQSSLISSLHRGHTVQAVLGCFELSKDAGFKIVTHMMPNLPNVDMQRDFEQFRFVCVCCRFHGTFCLFHVFLIKLTRTSSTESFFPY